MECKKCKVSKVSTDEATGLCGHCIWAEYERVLSVNTSLLNACKGVLSIIENVSLQDDSLEDLTNQGIFKEIVSCVNDAESE